VRTSFAALLLVGVCCAVIACAGAYSSSDETKAREAIDTLLERVSARDFEGAAELFNYPSTYTPAELQKDRSGVARGLELLVEEFGLPTDPKPIAGVVVNLQAAVGGGTLPYWQSKPNLGRDVTFIYAVTFAREGSGFVPCYFYRKGDRLEIQSVGFALPAGRPDAASRIGAVMRRMMGLMNEG